MRPPFFVIRFHQERLLELQKEPRHRDAVDDDHNHVTGLLELIQYTQPKSVIEIGAHTGVSTEAFALTCDHVVTVDPWANYYANAEQYLEQFNARMDKYTNVHAIRGRSPEALDFFADNTFDMCYIDGDHQIDSVTADIKACMRLIKPGGWYAGHDAHILDVMTAVRNCLESTCTRAQLFRDRSWLVKKVTQTPMRFVECATIA